MAEGIITRRGNKTEYNVVNAGYAQLISDATNNLGYCAEFSDVDSVTLAKAKYFTVTPQGNGGALTVFKKNGKCIYSGNSLSQEIAVTNTSVEFYCDWNNFHGSVFYLTIWY